MFKLFNPSSFSQQLTPEHRIWVQSVHKALSDIITQLNIQQTSALNEPQENLKIGNPEKESTK